MNEGKRESEEDGHFFCIYFISLGGARASHGNRINETVQFCDWKKSEEEMYQKDLKKGVSKINPMGWIWPIEPCHLVDELNGCTVTYCHSQNK